MKGDKKKTYREGYIKMGIYQQAIKEMCLQCVCGSYTEVVNCTAPNCALFEIRKDLFKGGKQKCKKN